MVGVFGKKRAVVLLCALAAATLVVLLAVAASKKPAAAATDQLPDLGMSKLTNITTAAVMVTMRWPARTEA